MSAVLVLVAAGLLSWVLRVLFVAVVPAARLPEPVRRGLDHAAPAVLAALVATSLAHDAGPLALLTPTPMLIALLAGGAVAWRGRRVLAGITTSLITFALLSAL